MLRIITSIIAILALSGCSPQPKPVVSQSKHTLSASEEFHLRGECAAIASKLNDSFVDPTPGQTFVTSNYSIKDNRCYALITSGTAFAGNRLVTLYDAQTKENLASIASQTGSIDEKGDTDPVLVQDFIDMRMKRDSQ